MADGLTQEEYLPGSNRVEAECIKNYTLNLGNASYKASLIKDTWNGVRPVGTPVIRVNTNGVVKGTSV